MVYSLLIPSSIYKILPDFLFVLASLE